MYDYVLRKLREKASLGINSRGLKANCPTFAANISCNMQKQKEAAGRHVSSTRVMYERPVLFAIITSHTFTATNE